MEQFRGGLVFKAHRLLYHSTLCSRVIKKEKKSRVRCRECRRPVFSGTPPLRAPSTSCPSHESGRVRCRPSTLTPLAHIKTPSCPAFSSSHQPSPKCDRSSSSSLLLSSLQLSGTQVYEPYIRTLLGTFPSEHGTYHKSRDRIWLRIH